MSYQEKVGGNEEMESRKYNYLVLVVDLGILSCFYKSFL